VSSSVSSCRDSFVAFTVSPTVSFKNSRSSSLLLAIETRVAEAHTVVAEAVTDAVAETMAKSVSEADSVAKTDSVAETDPVAEAVVQDGRHQDRATALLVPAPGC